MSHSFHKKKLAGLLILMRCINKLYLAVIVSHSPSHKAPWDPFNTNKKE